MKKTQYEKNVEQREKRDVWMDVILLSFDNNIHYDYPLPDHYHINNRVGTVLPQLKKEIPQKIVKELEDITFAWKDSCSRLENHILMGGYIFGNEWFYGYGTLYRWRDGQREKANERVKKYIPNNEKKYVNVIQDAIRIKTDGVKEFGLEKIIGSKND